VAHYSSNYKGLHHPGIEHGEDPNAVSNVSSFIDSLCRISLGAHWLFTRTDWRIHHMQSLPSNRSLPL